MEPDFPVDQVGTGLDTNALIAQQLAPIQALLNRPAPNINTGAPIVPEDAMKAAITRALGVNPPPLRDDQQSSVLGRIGAMLMQPRQQGQSVAGNIGAAVNAGSQMADASRKENQAMAMKQAELGSALATQDVNRRTAEANLQILSTKFPVEFAEMQQRLRKATLEGNAAEVDAIKNTLMLKDGAKRIVDSLNTAQQQQQANLKKTEAETRQHDAQSAYLKAQAEILLPAHAEAYRNLNKPDAVTVIDKDTGRVMVRRNDGTIDYVQITPGVQDVKQAREMARKQLIEEKIQEAKDKNVFMPGWRYTNPTEPEINTRAAEIMKGKVTVLHSDTSERAKKAGTPGATAPTGDVTQTTVPPLRKSATGAKGQEVLQQELVENQKVVNDKNADPNDRAEAQRNITRIQSELAGKGGQLPPSETTGEAVHTAGNFPGKPGSAQIDVTKAPGTPGAVTVIGPDGKPTAVTVLGGKPGAVEVPGAKTALPATPVKAAAVEDVAQPYERGRQTETAAVAAGLPGAQIPGMIVKGLKGATSATVEEARTILNKAKPTVNELLLLESFKDSPDLTDTERAKIRAALRRGKLGNYSG